MRGTPEAVPAFVLLALAAYRLYRLGARDTITEPISAAAAYGDDGPSSGSRRRTSTPDALASRPPL